MSTNFQKPDPNLDGNFSAHFDPTDEATWTREDYLEMDQVRDGEPDAPKHVCNRCRCPIDHAGYCTPCRMSNEAIATDPKTIAFGKRFNAAADYFAKRREV